MQHSATSSWDKATILPIQPGDLAHYWPHAVGFIERALEHTDGETSPEGIRSSIANQKRQLWIVKDLDRYIAAIVTAINICETGLKICEITCAGGSDHHKWDHFVDIIADEFKSQGCEFMDIVGRPGWQKLYQGRGFKPKYHVLRRQL